MTRRQFIVSACTGSALAAKEALAMDQTLTPFLHRVFPPGTEFALTEGHQYSKPETAIHGFKTHYGNDFAPKTWTVVTAPVRGYAIGSFHLAFASKENGQAVWKQRDARQYQGKSVSFGLGYFVQILAENGFYVLLAHLDDFDRRIIPFLDPIAREDGWDPTPVYQDVNKLKTLGRLVEVGQPIGPVGRSGCSIGILEAPNTHFNPTIDSLWWDEIHVHVEVYQRDSANRFRKFNRLDPCGVYGTADQYNLKQLPKNSLWVTDPDGLPLLIK